MSCSSISVYFVWKRKTTKQGHDNKTCCTKIKIAFLPREEEQLYNNTIFKCKYMDITQVKEKKKPPFVAAELHTTQHIVWTLTDSFQGKHAHRPYGNR
jgi:hypothetical protein